MTNKKRSGFTLIELLVVVVIIGVLASIAMPSFGRAQDMARNAALKSNVRNIQLALETYSTDNQSRYPATLLDSTFLTAPYYPNGALPKSPWSTQPQSANDPVAEAVMVSYWEELQGWAQNPAGGSQWSGTTGSVVASPTSYRHYGMVLYSYESAGNVYRIMGMAKNNKYILACNPISNGN